MADVGCGYGSSTILMAKHYPNSVIHGFDFHEPSIVAARESAEKEGVSNVEFFVSDAASMPDDGYDLACIFDALHDMGDPVGATSSICGRSNRTEPSWWSSLWLGTASRTIGTCWPVCFTASQPWCVCSHVQVEERRLGAGCPGRSETIDGSLEPSRLQQRSSRDRDTDQHGAQGPSLIRQVEADEIASLFLDAVADEQSAIDVGRHAPIDAADLGAAKFAEFRWRGFEEA